MNLKLIAIVALAPLVALPALADDKEDVLRNMAKCADVTDSLARLQCFDTGTPQLKAVLGIKPPGGGPKMIPVPAPQAGIPAPPEQAAVTHGMGTAPATVANADPTKEDRESWFGLNLFGGRKSPQTKPEQFGMENTPAARQVEIAPVPTEVEKISATVADYSLNPHGRFIVFLENGQIWRQAEADTENALFKRTAGDNEVVIERGALHSYTMRLNGKNRVFKVMRIK